MSYTLPIMVLDPSILPEYYRKHYNNWNWAYCDRHLTDIPPHGEKLFLSRIYSVQSIMKFARAEYTGALLFQVAVVWDDDFDDFESNATVSDAPPLGCDIWQTPNSDLAFDLKLRFG